MIRKLGAITITALAAIWSFFAWTGLATGLSGAPLAASLPFNQATAARHQLLTVHSPLNSAQREDLAKIALRRAPLSAQPLAYLALLAERGGDEGKTQRLLDAAKSLGWHDEAVQRIFYNWAASGNEHALAMSHAEALLRQGLASEDLTLDFARRSVDLKFRNAMVVMVSGQGKWADQWTALDAGRLDDASLTALFAAPGFRQIRSAESLSSLAQQLVQSGRARIAWRLAHGYDGGRPVSLEWLAQSEFPAISVFTWQLPEVFGVEHAEGQRQHLRRKDRFGTQPAMLRMGLEPGRYRLSFPGVSDSGSAGWRVMIACEANGPVRSAKVVPNVDFSVGQDCRQQLLTIAADLGTGSALSAPSVQRIGN